RVVGLRRARLDRGAVLRDVLRDEVERRPEVVHRRPEDPLLRELANRRPVEILAFLEVNPVVIAPVPEGLTPEVGVAKTLEMALRAAPEVVREDLGVRLGGPVIL